MANFTDYTGLKAEIASWLNREDLTDRIPGFIQLAEASFNRALHTTDMVQRVLADVETDYFALPADWQETIALSHVGQCELEFVSHAEAIRLRAMPHYGSSDRLPRKFTMFADHLQIMPAPTATVQLELVYRRTVEPLSDSAPTNWLLRKSPDLYLFRSLVASELFLDNDERVPTWRAEADRILFEMNEQSERAAKPQGRLAVKRRTFG